MQRSEQGEDGGTGDPGEWRDWRETEFPYFKGVLVSLIRAGFSRGKVKKLITRL
jgi:hypothetical protein